MPTGLANKPVTAPSERKFTFRCMAFQREEQWMAVCIDLDIFVQGDSAPDVKQKLHDQVSLYLETVLSGGSERGLIPRKAPWNYRLLWQLAQLAQWMNHKDRNREAFALEGTPGSLVIA